MAKKQDKTLLYVGIGALALVLLNRQQQPPPPPVYYPQVPPAPPRGSQAFGNWVKTIIDIYGDVASLWQPGGPFYKEKISPEQVQEIMNYTWMMT